MTDDSTSVERVPFNDEQYARLQALLGVAPLLREKNTVFGGSTGGVAPLATDLVELAEYVVVGVPFSVKAAALHDALNPIVGPVLFAEWFEGKPYEGGPDLEEPDPSPGNAQEDTPSFD